MKAGFGRINQIGYVVRDIEAAMNHWVTELGVGPWFYVQEVIPDKYLYRGVPATVRMSVALANSGDMQVELIQVNSGGPSFYHELLDAGLEGIHHISFWFESSEFEVKRDHLLSCGYKIGHCGEIGGPDGKFIYFDHDKQPGIIVEISECSGAKGNLFKMIAETAKNWDGTDPIRRVG